MFCKRSRCVYLHGRHSNIQCHRYESDWSHFNDNHRAVHFEQEKNGQGPELLVILVCVLFRYVRHPLAQRFEKCRDVVVRKHHQVYNLVNFNDVPLLSRWCYRRCNLQRPQCDKFQWHLGLCVACSIDSDLWLYLNKLLLPAFVVSTDLTQSVSESVDLALPRFQPSNWAVVWLYPARS